MELESILKTFKLNAKIINFQNQENYCYYDLNLNEKTKIKDFQKYQEEIALFLKFPKPTIKILHDQGLIRLEFVKPRNKQLLLFDYFSNFNVPNGETICLLGETLYGEKLWMNLEDNPHMIIAGTSGSGKSTLLHNIVANLLNYNSPNIILIDPKNIEFSEYQKIHDIQVFNSYQESIYIMDSLLSLMEERFSLIRKGYKKEKLPYIILIIDEFADLIMQDQDNILYNKLCKLSQKCRAAKISIILSTQRPSVDIISGTIKANFPIRISCKVASQIDSKVILDSIGAENLLGKGDAILKNSSNQQRFQIAYTSPQEVVKYYGQNSNFKI